MSEKEKAAWATGLLRSYSAHADLILQHFNQHRGPLELPRYTRSGTQFRFPSNLESNHSETDEEDDGQNSLDYERQNWRMSESTSSDERQPLQMPRAIEMGCGDCGALSGDLSELSLCQRPESAYEGEGEGGAPVSLATSSSGASSRAPRRFEEQELGEAPYTVLNESQDECDGSTAGERRWTFAEESSSAEGGRRLGGARFLRNISYENWALEKERSQQRRRDEEREAEALRQSLRERQVRDREEKERREYERYIQWLGRKKQEKLLKREILQKEMELQRRIQMAEENVKVANSASLRQWRKNKDAQLKASEKEEILKKKKALEEQEQEKRRRFEKSLEAYEKWRQKAKNTPRPATQGLLPHQKAKPAFTNPTPWKSLIDPDSDESDSNSKLPKFPAASIKSLRCKNTNVKR